MDSVTDWDSLWDRATKHVDFEGVRSEEDFIQRMINEFFVGRYNMAGITDKRIQLARELFNRHKEEFELVVEAPAVVVEKLPPPIYEVPEGRRELSYEEAQVVRAYLRSYDARDAYRVAEKLGVPDMRVMELIDELARGELELG